MKKTIGPTEYWFKCKHTDTIMCHSCERRFRILNSEKCWNPSSNDLYILVEKDSIGSKGDH